VSLFHMPLGSLILHSSVLSALAAVVTNRFLIQKTRLSNHCRLIRL